jgi:hypothetical protein
MIIYPFSGASISDWISTSKIFFKSAIEVRFHQRQMSDLAPFLVASADLIANLTGTAKPFSAFNHDLHPGPLL